MNSIPKTDLTTQDLLNDIRMFGISKENLEHLLILCYEIDSKAIFTWYCGEEANDKDKYTLNKIRNLFLRSKKPAETVKNTLAFIDKLKQKKTIPTVNQVNYPWVKITFYRQSGKRAHAVRH